MGTHHCGTFRGLLLGSVAAEVVHDVSCPVWVYSTLHHPMDTQSPAVRTIICAVELTREALPLLRFTSELAKNSARRSSWFTACLNPRYGPTNISIWTCTNPSCT